MSLVDGVATVDQVPGSTGTNWPVTGTLDVSTGRAAAVLCGRAEVFFDAGSRARLLGRSAQVCNVGLDAGRVVVDARRLVPGAVLAVSTVAGQVRVRGTIFAVEILDREVEVRVLEGLVEVSVPFLPSRRLAAGCVFRLGDERPRVLPEADEHRDRRLAGLPPPAPLRSEQPASVHPRIVPSPPVVGQATAVAAGELGPAAATAGSGSASRRAGVRRPDRDPDGAGGREPEAAVETPAQFLAAARRLRLAQDWLGAVSVYGELIAAFPSSAESRIALVTLGQIRLEHLRDAEAALQAFEEYLAGPATDLAEEAAWGRARALRELGREAEEGEALRVFLARHPASLWTQEAQVRLSELEGGP
ncbi:MAG: FecR domain-containing protein [Deltaproteobacteria bacterium]|nr:FecR domain-containing protein [Deltaproteobacteria bacterium]